MCGFVGLVSNKPINEKDLRAVVQMNKMLNHRGPDSDGYCNTEWFACGFSRLAIIDPDERSNQPMFDEDRRYLIIYNGEVYNHENLRNELKEMGYRFRTKSDTEVVLTSFIEWHTGCVEKFVGMFAFAIFDLKLKEVYLFRDQIGIKPLYFYAMKNKFYFSSEIKAFMVVSNLEANYDKLGEYSIFGSIAGNQTLFKNIFQLNPGSYVNVDNDIKLHTIQYYDIKQFFYKQRKNYSTCKVKELIHNSIMNHTKSDVGYGIQLSGGLDSSIIVAMINKLSIETFSIGLEGFENLDESKYQKMCSEKYGTIHNSYNFKNKDYLEYLLKSIWFFDYPLHHPNIVPMYIICEKAKERGVKVLLSGDGADEIFCGYNWNSNYKNMAKIDDIIYASSYTPPEVIKKVFSCLSFNMEEREKIIEDSGCVSTAILMLDQKLYLQKWLQRQDRMGMASSVEIRVPYCNIEIMECINGIDVDDKTDSQKTPKYILKKIAEEYLPHELVWRQKIGFGIPLEDWFRNKDGLGKLLCYLRDKIFKNRGIYDSLMVDRLIDDHILGKSNNGRILWMLLNIELWHRVFIDKTMATYSIQDCL